MTWELRAVNVQPGERVTVFDVTDSCTRLGRVSPVLSQQPGSPSLLKTPITVAWVAGPGSAT